MRQGARINVKHLRPDFRKGNFQKCGVCGKALHPNNKTGLCSQDWLRESVLNWFHQGYYHKWEETQKKKLQNEKRP